jgi:hypothetical protein
MLGSEKTASKVFHFVKKSGREMPSRQTVTTNSVVKHTQA